MFDDERTPLDHAHAHLMEAIRVCNIVQVQSILEQTPQAAQPMPGWRASPLQALAGSMHSFACTDDQLACMDILLEYGANPSQAHAYSPSPLNTILTRACVPALARMKETGALAKNIDAGVEGNSYGHHICSPLRWRDLGSRYPLDEMMALLISAGMDPTRNLFDPNREQPLIRYLLSSCIPQYGKQTPVSAENACLRVLEADNHTAIEPSFLVHAFRAGYNKAFKALAKRYEAQGHDISILARAPGITKDTERAQYDAWLLDAFSTEPSPAASTSRPRI